MIISARMKQLLNDKEKTLKGRERCLFMAKCTKALGIADQIEVVRELGWDTGSVKEGLRELETGIFTDFLHNRTTKSAKRRLPDLLNAIEYAVDSQSSLGLQTEQLTSAINNSGLMMAPKELESAKTLSEWAGNSFHK